MGKVNPNKNAIGLNHGIGALQWLVFLLANAVALPIVIGQVFHLSDPEITGLMQRTFFIVGASSFLQGWIGHKLPIVDGPAGGGCCRCSLRWYPASTCFCSPA